MGESITRGFAKLMAQLGDLIDLDAKTITGATLREVRRRDEECRSKNVIQRAEKKSDQAGKARWRCLHGNRAPARRGDKNIRRLSAKLRQKPACCGVRFRRKTWTMGRDDPRSSDADDVVCREMRPKARRQSGGRLSSHPAQLCRAGVRTWCGFRLRG